MRYNNLIMENSLSRVDIYNEDYIGLNHSYVQIYKSYNKLLECPDADEQVLSVLREILLVFNPTLDRIKSEMTVKTRIKEEKTEQSDVKAVNENHVSKNQNFSSSPVILHGNFTGD